MNTWTNEFGDRIFYEFYWGSAGTVSNYIATNVEFNKSRTFETLKSAKVWLNKFRKAKKWTPSKE